MKIRSRRNFWSGLVFVAVGVAFAWGATAYRMGDAAAPGPGFFPLGLGLLLALLGGLVLFASLTLEAPGGDPVEGLRWRPLLILPLAVAAFGAALPRLGLLAGMPLLVLLAALADEGLRWRDALLAAAALTAGAALVASLVPGLGLPLWPVAAAAR